MVLTSKKARNFILAVFPVFIGQVTQESPDLLGEKSPLYP